MRESLPSLIIVKTTMAASQGLFLLLGILVARHTLQAGMPLVQGMEWLLAVEVIAVAGFVGVQMVGLLGGGGRLLGQLRSVAAIGAGDTLVHADRAIATFYRRQPTRLTLSVLFNLLGWVAGAVETWLILRFLGAPLPAPTVLVIEAFGTGIRFATFFVPASLGTMEGGNVAIFLALGLDGALGLSVSLVRRVRQAAWVALGLVLLAREPTPTAAALRAAGGRAA